MSRLRVAGLSVDAAFSLPAPWEGTYCATAGEVGAQGAA